MKILRNSAKCLKCGDELESTYCHDFKECTCGNIFVDGGYDYVRHGWAQLELYQDTTEYND